MQLQSLLKELKQHSNKTQSQNLARFFKTGKGEYGEGDVFWGLTMPQIRLIVKKYYQTLSLSDIQQLINSPVHEVRMAGLIALTYQYERATLIQQKAIFNFYLKNTKRINNWDLVDVTCPRIVGMYLLDNDPQILFKLAKSKNLWERRIGMISTLALIKIKKDLDTPIQLANLLLNDKHDLMHKAVGWMLREVGKQDVNVLRSFLDENVDKMPRTMLRYSIEKLKIGERKGYLGIKSIIK